MKPGITNHRQGRLFEQRLSQLLNPNHELCLLTSYIKWDILDKKLSSFFDEEEGKPAKPSRLMAGIMILQHMYRLSDESVVVKWVENPYWQLFCGYDYLQWQFPIHPTTLTKWRNKLGTKGLEDLLVLVINTAKSLEAIEESSLEKVIVDTTVAPKAIAYPTDTKLYFSSLKKLVLFAHAAKIPLRQSYARIAPKVYRKANTLFHTRKYKKAMREVGRLKRFCKKVFDQVLKACTDDPELEKSIKPVFLVIAEMLMQGHEGMEKIYSLHEPKVECIAKGKAHQKYEFGCKMSLVITHKEGFVIGAEALQGAPYDGHTLQGALNHAERLTGKKINQAFVDKGYRGHGVTSSSVMISGSKKHLSPNQWKDLKRRQSIEPQIGHMKSDGKLGRNHLKGILGDKMHVLLCAIGHNMRYLVNFFRRKSEALLV